MNISLPKILITGGQGQLAQALCHHPHATKFILIPCSHRELDITEMSSISAVMSQWRPDIVINTAAYTAVDKAENEREFATKVNYDGVKNLTHACQQYQCLLFHISTDYVFNGQQTKPYHEEDPVAPLNFYGKTKLQAEEILREARTPYLILRVSGVFSEYGHNFVKTMWRLAQEREKLSIVHDQITCPTDAYDIAGIIYKLIEHYYLNKKFYSTLYHFCSTPPVSWYDFSTAIFAEIKKHRNIMLKEVKPITTNEYQAAALRPMNAVLACEKIQNDYGILQPDWRIGIERVIKILLSSLKH